MWRGGCIIKVGKPSGDPKSKLISTPERLPGRYHLGLPEKPPAGISAL